MSNKVSLVTPEGPRLVSGVGKSVTPEVLDRVLADLKPDDTIKARYKIEIQFGQDRSMSSLKPSVGVMLCWESGKRFHGGGDDLMYWCGYPDCDTPMSTENFTDYFAVCPTCHREQFLDGPDKLQHIEDARKRGINTGSLEQLPVVSDTKFFRLPPPKIAEVIEKVWIKLGFNADIYLKYHPSDIRYRSSEMTTKTYDELKKVRRMRGLHIYPLARILKDTAAGADPRRRFLAFITA